MNSRNAKQCHKWDNNFVICAYHFAFSQPPSKHYMQGMNNVYWGQLRSFKVSRRQIQLANRITKHDNKQCEEVEWKKKCVNWKYIRNKSMQCFWKLQGLTLSQENLSFTVFWKHHFEQAKIQVWWGVWKATKCQTYVAHDINLLY